MRNTKAQHHPPHATLLHTSRLAAITIIHFHLDSSGTSGDIRKVDYLRSFEHMDAADEYKPSPLDTRFITLRVSIFLARSLYAQPNQEGLLLEAPGGGSGRTCRWRLSQLLQEEGTGRRHRPEALGGGSRRTCRWRYLDAALACIAIESAI